MLTLVHNGVQGLQIKHWQITLAALRHYPKYIAIGVREPQQVFFFYFCSDNVHKFVYKTFWL